MFDKNDILAMLREGHSIEDIGEEIAEMLNSANTEYDNEVKEAERQKREEEELARLQKEEEERQQVEWRANLHDLVKELFDVLYDIGVMFQLPKEDLEYTDEDIEALIDILPPAIYSYVETKKRMERVQKMLDDDRITAELRRFADSL